MENWRPDLRFKASQHLLLVAGALGLFTAIALCSLPVLAYIKVFILIAFVWLFWVLTWRFLLLETRAAVTHLRYTDVGWFIRCAGQGGSWQEVELLGDSVVTEKYVFLRFSPYGAPWYKREVYPVIIASDSLRAEQFRRLKVFLRFIY